MHKGKLYLIPTSLKGEPLVQELSNNTLEIVKQIKYFVVETPKIGRSFLQGLGLIIHQLHFFELNENSDEYILRDIISALRDGIDVGVMSDAGTPGVGDMGTILVKKAHANDIEVFPLVGPSAIIMALAASGLNGQSFAFNGYLPKDQDKRIKSIQNLEEVSKRNNQTQIFIETPYRAQYIFEDILNNCKKDTYLSISVDLTSPKGFSKTMQIIEWKKQMINLNKRQVVFIIKA